MSGQVFDGSRALFNEDDACDPVNVYGRTKRDAEMLIQASLPCSGVKINRTQVTHTHNLTRAYAPCQRAPVQWCMPVRLCIAIAAAGCRAQPICVQHLEPGSPAHRKGGETTSSCAPPSSTARSAPPRCLACCSCSSSCPPWRRASRRRSSTTSSGPQSTSRCESTDFRG